MAVAARFRLRGFNAPTDPQDPDPLTNQSIFLSVQIFLTGPRSYRRGLLRKAKSFGRKPGSAGFPGRFPKLLQPRSYSGKPLLKTLRPLARLFFPVQPTAEPVESGRPQPMRQPGATKKVFLCYLNDALSGGGHR
jgi:hypothetical protein